MLRAHYKQSQYPSDASQAGIKPCQQPPHRGPSSLFFGNLRKAAAPGYGRLADLQAPRDVLPGKPRAGKLNNLALSLCPAAHHNTKKLEEGLNIRGELRVLIGYDSVKNGGFEEYRLKLP